MKEEDQDAEFNNDSIFSYIDSFVQRCLDLASVCEG